MRVLYGKLSEDKPLSGSLTGSQKLKGQLTLGIHGSGSENSVDGANDNSGILTGTLTSEGSLSGNLVGEQGIKGKLTLGTSSVNNNYNDLKNKPSINSVTLVGALTAEDLGLGRVYYDTTANWNIQQSLISERSVIYIYSDYKYLEDENENRVYVAGIKIGDGTSYLVDIPFVTDFTTSIIMTHISDQQAHTSSQEKEFWNNKVSSYLPSDDPENLVLSKTDYVVTGDIMYI